MISRYSVVSDRYTAVEKNLRAQHRMNGQDVFGSKILVSQPQKGTDWSRTPGRNRPNFRPNGPAFGKPVDNLLASNIHRPCTSPKIPNIENLRVRQINNDLRPAENNYFSKPQIKDRLNNEEMVQNSSYSQDLKVASSAGLSYSKVLQRTQQLQPPNNFDYRTDSSSGTYDEDSEGELIPRKIGHFGNSSEPVDLRVTGLDPQLDINLIKSLLADALNQITKVLNLSVFKQWDGSIVAAVKVKSMSDAQTVISRLQRARLGSQRIKIAFPSTCPEQLQRLRSQVAELLNELGNKKLPLFRFKEIFYNRFLTNVSVSELRRMSDLCVITEEEGARMISGTGWNRKSPKTLLAVETKDNPYCRIHFDQTTSLFQDVTNLPCIIIGIGLLNERIQELLKSHNGVLPLATLHHCYQAQFGSLEVNEKDGVSLEHLVSCVPNVEIHHSSAMLKFLEWADSDKTTGTDNTGNGLWDRSLTSELMDLLKSEPKSTIPFQSLIPLYHRRFGKQFRLSDFGHTKLLDLLESLPHVVQVIGFGMTKMVTLTHKAQMKRFRNDLLKLIKNQPNKTIDLEYFSEAYLKQFSKAFHPANYGLCYLKDLVTFTTSEFQLTKLENDRLFISIPIKERTQQEIELTETFKTEVIEVLKTNRDCSIPFNKFIPAYHNLFGRQCRVSSYGFFKLIDLFEAIPDIATVEESSLGEKFVMLTLNERLKVLGERLVNIVNWEGGSILLADLEIAYEFYDYGGLEPFEYECDSLPSLLNQLVDYIKLVASPQGCLLIAQPVLDVTVLNLRIRFLLLEKPQISIENFRELYQKQYPGEDINVELSVSRIPKAATIILDSVTDQKQIALSPQEQFANLVYRLLADEPDSTIPLVNFEAAFAKKFGRACNPQEYGLGTVSQLLNSFPEMFVVSGSNGGVRVLVLRDEIAEVGYDIPKKAGEMRAVRQLGPQQQFPGKFNCVESLKPSMYNMWTCRNPIVSPIVVPEASDVPLPNVLLELKPRRNRIAAQLEQKN